MLKHYLLAIEMEPEHWSTFQVVVHRQGVEGMMDFLIPHCRNVVEQEAPGKHFRIYEPSNKLFDLSSKIIYDSKDDDIYDLTIPEVTFNLLGDDHESGVIEDFMDKNHIGTCPNCYSLIDASCLDWKNQEDRDGNFMVILRFVCRECSAEAFSMAEYGFVDSPAQVMEKYL